MAKINVKLLPVKVLLFTFNGGAYSIMPYLGLHARSIGLTTAQFGILSALLQICGSCGSTLAGMFADKTGCYRLLLAAAVLLSAGSHIILHFTFPVSATNTSCSGNDTNASVNRNITTDSQEIYSAISVGTLTAYCALRLICFLLLNICFCTLDAWTLQLMAVHKGDLGRNRAFGQAGMMCFPVISGLLVDLSSRNSSVATFAPAFYMFCGLLLFSGPIIMLMDDGIPAVKLFVWKEVGNALRVCEVWEFLSQVFVIGFSLGCLESFLFWFLESALSAPKWLLGFTDLMSGLAGIVANVYSSLIIKKCGHVNLLLLAIVIYGIRFAGCAALYNPFLVLPLEALEAGSNALMWTVAMQRAQHLMPNSVATINGLIRDVHIGLGITSGGIAGGYSVDYFGYRRTFAAFSVICFSYAAAHGLFLFWCKQNSHSKLNSSELKNTLESAELINTKPQHLPESLQA